MHERQTVEDDVVDVIERPLDIAAKRVPSGLGLEVPFRWLTSAAALLVVAALGAMLVVLVIWSWPALGRFGPGFIVSSHWNPVTEVFGAAAPSSTGHNPNCNARAAATARSSGMPK